ncbi:MAG: hypothetical protein H7Y10_02205 [Flavobacterium sp.]|nr:hypothetical protein [Flavobacterium sp.]
MDSRLLSFNRILFYAFLFFTYSPDAKAQTNLLLNWAKSFNPDRPAFNDAKSLITDASGNIYVTGSFYGTADFDPSEGVANLTSTGTSDIFLAKYDANGNYVFAKGMKGPKMEWGTAIAVDTSGNVYLTGVFEDTVDFDPSTKVAKLTSTGNFDIFIAKYDTNGKYIYAKSMEGTDDSRSTAIAVDNNRNTYIIGYFFGVSDFFPGKGVANLTSSGGCDLFLAKYDTNGNYVYGKSIGGKGYDSGSGIAVDKSGNVCITGKFARIVDFDPGMGVVNLTCQGNENIFLAKYDTNGNYIFAKSMGGKRTDLSNAIAVDTNGNSYITGFFEGTADFDPSDRTATLTSPEPYGLYIAKYDSNGNYIYAKSVSGGKGVIGESIAVDNSGSTYITGHFEGTADFDPSDGVANLTSPGRTKDMSGYESDLFIAKYDTNGNYVYAKSMGGKGYDISSDIALDGNGNIYITGEFKTPANFDPSVSTYDLKSESASAPFVASYREKSNATEDNELKK